MSYLLIHFFSGHLFDNTKVVKFCCKNYHQRLGWCMYFAHKITRFYLTILFDT